MEKILAICALLVALVVGTQPQFAAAQPAYPRQVQCGIYLGDDRSGYTKIFTVLSEEQYKELKSAFKTYAATTANPDSWECTSPESLEGGRSTANTYVQISFDWRATPTVTSADRDSGELGFRCYAAAFKPSEGDHSGMYPRYVYYSLLVPATTQISAFERYVKQKYGHMANGTPNLNIYKSICASRTYRSVDDFVAQVRQDGGVSSITQVATYWKP